MPGKHAVLSASSSDRWIHCPPSARLCENYDDAGSDYAAEGTDAHTLCEYRLRSALGLPAEDPVEKLSWYSEEMEECAEAYVSYVLELVEAAKQAGSTPTVLIEQKVDFSRWVNEGFGTADCVVIANGILNIVDYKHGKGVEVSAEENSQMMLYTETVQCLFITAYNRLMQNRKQVIEDCELMRRVLTDFGALDADIERQLEEIQIVAELVKTAVRENASTAQSQEAYLKKYDALTNRYETAAAELERLQSLRTLRSQQDKAMALFIRTLKKQPEVLNEWDDTIWTVMVEKAIVHKDGQITFVFFNGTEIKVGI